MLNSTHIVCVGKRVTVYVLYVCVILCVEIGRRNIQSLSNLSCTSSFIRSSFSFFFCTGTSIQETQLITDSPQLTEEYIGFRVKVYLQGFSRLTWIWFLSKPRIVMHASISIFCFSFRKLIFESSILAIRFGCLYVRSLIQNLHENQVWLLCVIWKL